MAFELEKHWIQFNIRLFKTIAIQKGKKERYVAKPNAFRWPNYADGRLFSIAYFGTARPKPDTHALTCTQAGRSSKEAHLNFLLCYFHCHFPLSTLNHANILLVWCANIPINILDSIRNRHQPPVSQYSKAFLSKNFPIPIRKQRRVKKK